MSKSAVWGEIKPDACRGFLAFIALFTGISLPSVYALDPDKAITQYAHDIWQVEDGLPQNSAGAVVQTRDGYLWIGTEEGLVRFDGVRFTVFDKNNTPAIQQNFVDGLLEDHEGTLWIATYGGGLVQMKNGTELQGMSDTTITTMTMTALRRRRSRFACLHHLIFRGAWFTDKQSARIEYDQPLARVIGLEGQAPTT